MKSFPISSSTAASLCLAAALLHLPSAAGAVPDGAKLDAFAARIETGLLNKCVGFGYAIFQGKQFVRGGGGGAREKIEGPYGDHPFDENTQKDCHSMSKTISAAAMIKALQMRNVRLDARIYDYFPKRLQNATPVGMSPSNINNALIKIITFEQMLGHKSGFAQSAKTWDQLKEELEAGLDYIPGNNGNGSVYANWNYGMCRLLIPYVLHTNWFRENEGKRTKGQLEALTAEIYTDFVRDRILKPAGAHATRTRPPQNPTTANFAYLYDFMNDDAEGLMPNRQLDLGSGGWAMSAKTFGKFLVALFDEELMFSQVRLGGNFVNALDRMKSERLGMFTWNGSAGESYYVHRGANSWSGQGGSVGGKSIWMHFPSEDIVVVVQINSHKNANTGLGVERDRMLQEAFDEVYSSPAPSQFQHPINLFASRAQDGWVASRGVRASGGMSSSDFDTYEEPGWEHTRFFSSAGRSFGLRYNPDNGAGHGSLKVQRMNLDGTLAETVYASDTWRKGWTHLEVFTKNAAQDVYLLLHDHVGGKLRTYRIDDQGKPVSPKITDVDVTPGFDIMKIVRLSGEAHLLRYNSSNGWIHVRELDDDGSWGSTVYEKYWKKGFTTFEFYQTGSGDQYLLRYKAADGHANILRFPPSIAGLEQTVEVLDQTWKTGWKTMRFFRTTEGTFNFRYNPTSGDVRIQKIRQNGTFGTEAYTQDGFWLKETTSSGTFDWDTTGWTSIEFYQAKDAGVPAIPMPGGDKLYGGPSDNDDLQLATVVPLRSMREPELKRAEIQATVQRGRLNLSWKAAPNAFYLAEKSTNLRDWEPVDVLEGAASSALNFNRELALPGRGEPGGPKKGEGQAFYRIRTVAKAPEATVDPGIVIVPGARRDR